MTKNDKEQLAMAEFMGFHFIPKGTLEGQPNDSWNVKSNIPVYLSNWSELQFKNNPEWLFPVIYKIEKLALREGVVSGLRQLEPSKNTFEDCMVFINWYNENCALAGN